MTTPRSYVDDAGGTVVLAAQLGSGGEGAVFAVEGRPALGYQIRRVQIEPPRVRITGARSEVLRLSEVVTEMIDVTGATETIEREVRVSPGAGHVWADEPRTVKGRVQIEAEPPPPEDEAPAAKVGREATGGTRGQGGS